MFNWKGSKKRKEKEAARDDRLRRKLVEDYAPWYPTETSYAPVAQKPSETNFHGGGGSFGGGGSSSSYDSCSSDVGSSDSGSSGCDSGNSGN